MRDRSCWVEMELAAAPRAHQLVVHAATSGVSGSMVTTMSANATSAATEAARVRPALLDDPRAGLVAVERR
jgi:hypothetical protein